MTDFFTATTGFASLDEVEDLIDLIFEEPGAYRSVDGRLWTRYRTSGGGVTARDRYNTLVSIWGSLPPELQGRVLSIYNNRYGLLPGLASEAEVNAFNDDDAIFSDYVPRNRTGITIGPDGLPQGVFGDAGFGVRRPVEGPAIGPGSIPELGFGNVPDPGQRAVEREAAEANSELEARERQEFIDELNSQRDLTLSRLGQDQASLAEQFELGQRNAEFGQAIGNLSGPLTATRGNFNSGFQRQRRGINNTGFGFQDRARRLTYQNQLRSIARQREDIQQSYQDAIDAFDRQNQLSSLGDLGIPGDDLIEGITQGDI